jgi:hypothetical protein
MRKLDMGRGVPPWVPIQARGAERWACTDQAVRGLEKPPYRPEQCAAWSDPLISNQAFVGLNLNQIHA